MVYFTLGDALRLGGEYIRRRFQRTVINVASISLANSFFTSLTLIDLLYETYSRLQGDGVAVDAYQYWLLIVALIVSMVGITNAMLISVYERYREIGTMKCIGALDQHILMLFLVEAIIQGLVGGILGFLLGVFSAVISSGFTTGFDIILKVPAISMLISFGSSGERVNFHQWRR